MNHPLPIRRPERRGGSWSVLAWAIVGLVVVGGTLWVTRSVVSICFTSAVFAWLLDRPVSAIQARGASRDFGIALVSLAFFVAVAVVAVWVVPDAARQIAHLAENLKPYLERVATEFGPFVARLERRFGIDLPVDVSELGVLAPEYLKKLTPDVRSHIQAWLTGAASGGLSLLLAVLSLSLLPLFTFLLLRDWPALVAFVGRLVPLRAQPTTILLAAEIDARLAGWVRGQLTVAVVLGVLYSIGFRLSGIDLSVTIGLLGGALFLLPYIGPLITGALAVSLALLKFGGDWHVGAVVGTLIVAQALEGAVLTPLLVGDRVGLHPMVVMLAILVGGNVFGIVGIIIAVPVTAALAVIGAWALDEWRASRTYRG